MSGTSRRRDFPDIPGARVGPVALLAPGAGHAHTPAPILGWLGPGLAAAQLALAAVAGLVALRR